MIIRNKIMIIFLVLFSFLFATVQSVVSAMSVNQPIESDLTNVLNIYKNLRSERSLPSRYRSDVQVRTLDYVLASIDAKTSLQSFVEQVALADLSGKDLIAVLSSFYNRLEQYDNMANFLEHLFGISPQK